MEQLEEYITNLCNVYDYQSLLQSTENEEIYHYTTSNTLAEIIEQNKLRFSNRLYMNDSSEGQYVLDLCIRKINDIWHTDCKYDKQEFIKSVEELKKRLKLQYFQFYQASFSLEKDNLTMWNYYSKGNGINIKFESKTLLSSLEKHVKGAVVKPVAFLHGRVIYEEDKQVEILKKVLDDFSRVNQYDNEWYLFAPMAVLNIGTFFKHYGFRDEREYRIAYNLYNNLEDPTSCLSLYQDVEHKEAYRFNVYQKENMLIPYVDVHFDNDAIKGIVLSPRLITEYYVDGLRLLLDMNGLNKENIKIEKSSIPLRL